MLALAADRQVRGVILWDVSSLFSARSMIDKVLDRDEPGEFHDATGMVSVKVSQDEVIDLADSSQFRDAGNPTSDPTLRRG